MRYSAVQEKPIDYCPTEGLRPSLLSLFLVGTNLAHKRRKVKKILGYSEAIGEFGIIFFVELDDSESAAPALSRGFQCGLTFF